MDIDQLVARNIRRSRLNRRISQEALADEAGLNRSYMGALERGEKSPTVRTLALIASALGVSVADLVSLDSSPMPPNLPRGPRN